MGDSTPNLFEGLNLKNWYKYLLYVAGVLLILVIVLGSKIPQEQVISFSLWTMVLMIFVWIINDICYAFASKDNINTVAGVNWFIQLLFFLFWVLIAFRSLV
jgi:hypothetical protein